MTKRALIYARVSYDDRPNEDRNLEGQIEDGQAYCQEKGYRIVAELAEDDRGASGASWDLPKLNQALDMARAGEFDVLVTRELDRFARGLAKQLVIEGEFKRYGVECEYILAEYDDSPEGRLNKHIRAVIAEFEREKINQRMTRGRRQVVKSGKVMLHGNKPPYGYRVEDGMLVVYEPEARIVGLIFTWYVHGDENGKKLSIRAIAQRLTEMTIPTYTDKRANKPKARKRGEWSPSVVSNLLSNETYCGLWHYKLSDGWLSVEVSAIVGRKLWESAQERKVYNRVMARRNGKNDYLMSGRITCQCATKMSGRATARAAKSKKYLYYYCPASRGMLASKVCDAPGFRADHVDKAVWHWVKSILLNPETLRRDLEAQKAEQEEVNKPLWDRLAVIDDLLADNRQKLERLLDLYLSGDFDKEVLAERKNRLETTITALEKEREDLIITLESQTLTNEQIATVEDFAKEVSEGLEIADQDFDIRRQIIDLLDVRVTLAIEEGQKIAYVRCRVGEKSLSIVSTNPRSPY